jgi:hypothetical protein
MTYSSGGLIQASDYNGFAGGNGGGANVSGQLNTVLGTGYGNAGYGQTSVSNVSVAGSVTAAQWSTLVGGVNKVRSHQTTFTNLSLYTSGDTINATTDVGTNLTNAYTGRLGYQTLGSVTTGSNFTLNISSPNTTAAVTASAERTATFASADSARYFFNAGGELRFYIASYVNPGGTVRGSTLGGLAVNGAGGKTFKAVDNSARYGTAYTVTTDLTTGAGYYSLTTSYVDKIKISGSAYGAAYNGDFVSIQAKSNGAQGSNGDKGTIFYFNLTLNSAAQSPAFNDSINMTVTYRIDTAHPSSTYLSDTWGTTVIA